MGLFVVVGFIINLLAQLSNHNHWTLYLSRSRSIMLQIKCEISRFYDLELYFSSKVSFFQRFLYNSENLLQFQNKIILIIGIISDILFQNEFLIADPSFSFRQSHCVYLLPVSLCVWLRLCFCTLCQNQKIR